MARILVRDRSQLDALLTLAPERYDDDAGTDGVALTALVEISGAALRPGETGPFVILDTTHAVDGFIATRPLQSVPALNSSKKRLLPGDVIVSRLRPYLRQIALVDAALAERFAGATLCCSTEFFVLRAKDALPVDFLVPFLLTPTVQSVLARSQEGGHHPRVPAETLARLCVPRALVENRAATSAAFVHSLEALRHAERQRDVLIQAAEISR
jgi:hypothetical protein